MSTNLINEYWNGESLNPLHKNQRRQQLLTDLVTALNGVTYTQSCVTSNGKTYKKLVIENEDTFDN